MKMPERIDEELARIYGRGETPKTIYVGSRLYLELETEQNNLWGASLENVQSHAPVKEVTEYKGIPVKQLDGVDMDYLRIET
jgi:hypothetical protein